MHIAPVHPKEENRQASLKQSKLIDTLPNLEFYRLVFIAAQVCRVPMAALTLIDADRQWIKLKVGTTIAETSRDVSFCSHTILEPNIMIVEDAANDARFRDNPFVIESPFIRFYAGVPVFSADGYPLGSFCILDRSPRRLGQRETFLLKQLAREAEALIERYSL